MANIRSKYSRPGFKVCGCGDGACDTCHPKVQDLLDDAIEELRTGETSFAGNREYVTLTKKEWTLIHELVSYAKTAIEEESVGK